MKMSKSVLELYLCLREYTNAFRYILEINSQCVFAIHLRVNLSTKKFRHINLFYRHIINIYNDISY